MISRYGNITDAHTVVHNRKNNFNGTNSKPFD